MYIMSIILNFHWLILCRTKSGKMKFKSSTSRIVQCYICFLNWPTRPRRPNRRSLFSHIVSVRPENKNTRTALTLLPGKQNICLLLRATCMKIMTTNWLGPGGSFRLVSSSFYGSFRLWRWKSAKHIWKCKRRTATLLCPWQDKRFLRHRPGSQENYVHTVSRECLSKGTHDKIIKCDIQPFLSYDV